jgi:hypothetical protein
MQSGRLQRDLAALRISKLEGDAAFAYALESEMEASMLLDTMDETYFAFQSRLTSVRQPLRLQRLPAHYPTSTSNSWLGRFVPTR